MFSSHSGVFVTQGYGPLVMGASLGEQCLGLGLEHLYGVGTRREPTRWFLERDELHEGLRELGGIARWNHSRRMFLIRTRGDRQTDWIVLTSDGPIEMPPADTRRSEHSAEGHPPRLRLSVLGPNPARG